MNLQPADRFDWERVVRRCALPGPTKLVALLLASYADRNGREVRPGLPRLAAVARQGESTARRHVELLRHLGLIEKLANGGGPRKKAALYRLTIPEDLLERVELLDVDETTPLSVRSGVTPSRRPASPLTQTSGVGPVDNEGTPLTQVSDVVEPEDAELRSLSEVTPLTSAPNSAHSGEHLPTISPTKDHPEPLVLEATHQSVHRPRPRRRPNRAS